MEDDTITPGPAADGAEVEEGKDDELDPDLVEDTFDDVDPL